MSNVGFRSWGSFVDSEESGIEVAWKRAIVQLAVIQHGESERAKELPAPEYDDATTVFDETASKKLLPWWPEKLERVSIRVRITPNGQTTETLSPVLIDPNTKDLGKTMFVNALTNQLEGQGDFDGTLQIQILRATDKSIIGTMRQEVLVGAKAKKKRGGGGVGDERDDRLEEFEKRDARQMDMIERMFNNSAHTLGAAATVVQATRGVNPAPLWMQDGEGGPLWMTLLNGAMQIGGALVGGKDPKREIRRIMSEPTHPMLDGGGGGNRMDQVQSPPQLPDYGPREESQNYGSDQFLEEGQYDGFRVVNDDLLDDGFGEEDDGEYEYEGDVEEDSEEDDEEDEDERPKKKRDSGNPLDGLPPDKVGKLVEEWVDRNIKTHRSEIHGFGMRLAGKVLKG